jgi:hypothetical protein
MEVIECSEMNLTGMSQIKLPASSVEEPNYAVEEVDEIRRSMPASLPKCVGIRYAISNKPEARVAYGPSTW